MSEIYKPIKSTYYVLKSPDNSIVHYGVTPPNNVTTSGLPLLETTESEIEYLNLLGSVVGALEELPEEGVELRSGEIYRYNTIAVKVRQDHTRTFHDPTTVPALFSVYQEGASLDWIPGEQVELDMVRIYNTISYEVIQAHQTQLGWEPPNVPALWKVEGAPTLNDQWAAGVTYPVNHLVYYNEIRYYCIQAHTSQLGWEPPNVPALWGIYVEPPITYPDWELDTFYTIDTIVNYQGDNYICITQHTSSVEDTPEKPVLWTLL